MALIVVNQWRWSNSPCYWKPVLNKSMHGIPLDKIIGSQMSIWPSLLQQNLREIFREGIRKFLVLLKEPVEETFSFLLVYMWYECESWNSSSYFVLMRRADLIMTSIYWGGLRESSQRNRTGIKPCLMPILNMTFQFYVSFYKIFC